MEENEYIEEKKYESSIMTFKNIEYTKAPFARRAFACFLDAIIFLFVFLCCFLLTRKITIDNKNYKKNINELTEIKLASGLYDRDPNNVVTDTITILDKAPEHNPYSRKRAAANAIEKFYTFAKDYSSSEEAYSKMVQDYKDFRLDPSMSVDGTPMFVVVDDEIVENEALISTASGKTSNIYKEYYEKCYKAFMDDYLQGCLNTKIPRYLELNKYIVKVLIVAEVLPAFVVSFVVVYYVPGLIFKHGRSSFGKRLYNIASVDANCLSPSLLRYTAKTALFLFELVLAFPSFGATLLISFSMMALSKQKQGFPDYVCQINEVKIENNKIYMSFDEADLDNVQTHKKAIDFKAQNTID